MKIKMLKEQSIVGNKNPFQESSFVSMGGLDYLIGALLILLGLLSLYFVKRSREKMLDYKKRQLEEYNKNHPREKNVKDYAKTSLYLPIGERMKYMAPIIFAVLCFFVAITFFAGRPIQTL